MKFNKNKTKQPRKQRGAFYKANIHTLKAILNVHLSKELAKKYKKRALIAKKGDKVKIVRGDFSKKEGKIIDVDVKKGKIFIEGVIKKKQGGKEVPAAIQPSNCIILEWVEPKMKEKRSGKGAKVSTSQAKQTVNIKPAASKPSAPIQSTKPIVSDIKPINQAAKPAAGVNQTSPATSSK